MANVLHNRLNNDPLNSALHNLHSPGYIVANASARNAIATATNGDLCFQSDIGYYFTYLNGIWLQIAFITNQSFVIINSTSSAINSLIGAYGGQFCYLTDTGQMVYWNAVTTTWVYL